MVKSEDILKQQLFDLLDENYFKHQYQVCINYSNHTLSVLIQHLHDDHEAISPMDIEESCQKMKQG